MSERKNIERLFQERFKDFEVNPPPQAWGNIEAKLGKREIKAKTAIPFWLKAAGIAAVLLLGYFTADNYTELTNFNTNGKNTETVVSSGSSNGINNQKKDNGKGEANENSKHNPIPNQENAVATNEEMQGDESSAANTIESNPSGMNAVSSGKSNNGNKTVPFGKTGKPQQTHYKTPLQQNAANGIAVVPNLKKAKNKRLNNPSANENRIISSSYDENQQLAQNGANEGRQLKNGIPATDKNQQMAKKSQHIIAKLSEDLIKKASAANATFINEGKNSSAINASNQDSNPDKNVPVINEGKNASAANTTNLALNNIVKITKDSTVVAVVPENPLEKILKEKENKDKEEKKIAANSAKWKVRPNVAPIFMSSSKGSPIDSQFGDNAKGYENNISVGLGVDYAVTSKISLRTGISKLDLGYNTNGIVYYEDLNTKGLNTKTLKNINLRPEASGMVVEDKSTSASQELAFQNKEEGYLNQQMNYMEIPVEVSYKLIDKKFGLQLITGLSTLFLNDNKVSVVSNGFSTTLGEANNLNKVHFSTNIGIGVKYSFWKSFEANFEPTLKYQINTFNENSGGFKPYIIGLYTGISFRF